MTDIKRTNYATGQFLTAADFDREQTYHMGLRHLHNQNLHTPGIVQGLVVTKADDTHVTVGPGMALDPMGREMVVAAPVTLSASALKPAGSYYLMIGYADVLDPADKIEIGGSDAYVATTERPAFSFVEIVANTSGTAPPGGSTAMPPPAGSVLVAVVDMQGEKVSDTGTDDCVYAGPALPPKLTASSLTVNRLNVPGEADLGAVGVKSLSVAGPGPMNVYGPISSPMGQLLFSAPGNQLSNDCNGFGHASFQNAIDFAALVITGRTVREASQPNGLLRQIQLYDTVQVNGSLSIVNSENSALGPSGLSVAGTLTVGGRALLGAKSGYVMDQFVNRLGETLETGDVVVIAAGDVGYYGEGNSIPVPEVDLTGRIYDTRVCGIVCEVHGETGANSEPPRIFTGIERGTMDTTRVAPGQIGHMVTLGAYAWCKVDANIAPVVAGDLLTTSPTRGHAQKALDRGQAIGAIVGKALAGLERGRGTVPVMVMLQ